MTTQVKRTLIAQQALETSDLLNLRFQSRLVGTATPRKLMVAVPDGPSSDGGKKVRQSIVLAPAHAKDAAAGTVMVGWLDIVQKRAELRVHAVVKSQFEQRWHQPFDVPKEPYDALMRDVQSMLGVQEIEVAVIQAVPQGHGDESRATMADVPRAAIAADASSATNTTSLIAIALGTLLLVGLAAGAYAVLGR